MRQRREQTQRCSRSSRVRFLFSVPSLCAALAFGADKKGTERPGQVAAPTKIAGLLIDRQDNSISVKADGEDEPVKYTIGNRPDRKLVEELKAVFAASRVMLTYKTEGESRRLLSIQRHIPKAAGTVTGTVVKNYTWWIEVKPKQGLSDGYAPNFAGFKDKQFMERLKALQPGDSVTIRFTTDFERHRIEAMRKNEKTESKRGDQPPSKKND